MGSGRRAAADWLGGTVSRGLCSAPAWLLHCEVCDPTQQRRPFKTCTPACCRAGASPAASGSDDSGGEEGDDPIESADEASAAAEAADADFQMEDEEVAAEEEEEEELQQQSAESGWEEEEEEEAEVVPQLRANRCAEACGWLGRAACVHCSHKYPPGIECQADVALLPALALLWLYCRRARRTAKQGQAEKDEEEEEASSHGEKADVAPGCDRHPPTPVAMQTASPYAEVSCWAVY